MVGKYSPPMSVTGARERGCRPDDDAHTYRSEPVGNSLCVLSLSPPVACVPLGLVSSYPKEIEAYRSERASL